MLGIITFRASLKYNICNSKVMVMTPLLHSKGRRYPEIDGLLSNDSFLNDFLILCQCKAYRRSADKTQVITSPDNPHVRTRLFHANEVMGIAVPIAERLGLNVNLCMAIAMGHDIGHAPYGHTGEKVFTEYGKKPFKHNIFSVVIAQHIERRGRGLNLCYETLEGILRHSAGPGALEFNPNQPQEYSVVLVSDKIAYTFSDINDAIRYGYLSEDALPKSAYELGQNQMQRNRKLIEAVVTESLEKGYVCFSEGEVFENFDSLKAFMYKEFYYKINHSLHEKILYEACAFFDLHNLECYGVDPVICAALLTDSEINKFGSLLLETKRVSIDHIKHFGVFEILPHLEGKKIDYCDADLDWELYSS